MVNGSGTSFNTPYDTQNDGILPIPYPSATGGNTYLYEQGGNNLNYSAAIVPTSGGRKGKNYSRRKYNKLPKYISNKKEKKRKIKTNKIKKNNKKKCQVCNFKIF